MPSTIYDTYEAALNNKFTWLRALVLTDLLSIDEEGIKVCPPPSTYHEYNNYKVKLAALKGHPNNNAYYKNVVEHLQRYVTDCRRTNSKE